MSVSVLLCVCGVRPSVSMCDRVNVRMCTLDLIELPRTRRN